MIQGKKEIIERVKEAKPGDPAVYVNMDAIEQLPDEYESTIVDVDFDIKRDFAFVGSESKPSWYPTVFFMNRIADKRGIIGHGEAVVEAIYEDVNVSLMEMCDEPRIMHMKVGYKVSKQGAVLQEDGQFRPCSPRTGMYNVWEECCLLWTKEEMYTEGYSKAGKYPNKYDTKWKRRNHFQSEMDKALGIADSVAWSKCIRELTGMQTGYSTDDLKEGKFYFAKIRRSKLAIKAESAARLSAMSQGKQIERNPQELLFGPTEQKEEVVYETKKEIFDPPPPEPQKTKREIFINLIEAYRKENIIPEDAVETINNVYNWLVKNKEAENDKTFWPKAIAILQSLEKVIPEVGRISHTLY